MGKYRDWINGFFDTVFIWCHYILTRSGVDEEESRLSLDIVRRLDYRLFWKTFKERRLKRK